MNIIGCWIESGSINFDKNNYDLTITGNKLENGVVYLRFGNVLGNDLKYNGVNASVLHVKTGEVASDDTLHILGNRIQGVNDNNTFGGTYYYSGIDWDNNTQNFNIRNNYCYLKVTGSHIASAGIRIGSAKSSGVNKLSNNTLGNPSGVTVVYGVIVYSASTDIYLYNNLIKAGNTGVYCNVAANITNGYNAIEAPTPANGTGISLTGTNNTTSAVVFDATSGEADAGSDAIGGGSIDPVYTDIDLSRNDAGCYGGPYTMANYFPQTFNGVPRVYFVDMPHRVIKGSTFSVSAEGVDK